MKPVGNHVDQLIHDIRLATHWRKTKLDPNFIKDTNTNSSTE